MDGHGCGVGAFVLCESGLNFTGCGPACSGTALITVAAVRCIITASADFLGRVVFFIGFVLLRDGRMGVLPLLQHPPKRLICRFTRRALRGDAPGAMIRQRWIGFQRRFACLILGRVGQGNCIVENKRGTVACNAFWRRS